MLTRLQGQRSGYLFDPENTKTCLRKNGRFSRVYLGKDESNGETVIIKNLHPRLRNNETERQRFIAEFRPDLQSPDIALSLDWVEDDRDLYLIRAYVKGTDLREWIRSGAFKQLNNAGKRELLQNMLKPLATLHAMGFIHGDVKPSNFILRDDRSLALIDLGLMIPVDVNQRPPRNKQHPLPFSLLYSAPELMLNFPQWLMPSTDLYSLGVIWYELLCNEVPWKEKNPAVLMNLQMVYPFPEHAALGKSALRFLNKMSAKHAFSEPPVRLSDARQEEGLRAGLSARFQSVSELGEELTLVPDEDLFRKKKWWQF